MTPRGILLLAAFCGVLGAADSRDLTGRVVDAQTGQPIARAQVRLQIFQGSQQGVQVAVLSDADGSFRVTNVPDGGYNVTCEKAGYLTNSQGVMPRAMPQTRAANTQPNAQPTPLVIRLTAQAAIEGTVVDDKDMPAENIFIQLVLPQVVNGHRQFMPSMGGGTDETGSFRLFGLSAGRYYISITGRVSGVRRAKSLAYPPLFYPNSTEIEAAQPIDLKAGDEQQIKIRLPEPVRAREVRGEVAAAGPSVSVTLTRQSISQFPFPNNITSNWDAKTGAFRITGVTPGIYLLTAGVSHGGREYLQTSTMVTVGDADVTGIRLEPAHTGLDGTVRVEGSTGQQRPVYYVALQSQRAGNGAQVDPDGKFHVTDPAAGAYRVVPQISGPWCVRSIQQGGRDVRDGLVVTEGATAPVDIVVTSHCGSVQASLAPSDSTWPQDLTLALLRRSGDELVLEKEGYLNGRVNSSAFLLQGVAPGDYTLYAWPRDAQIEYANPEYMRQFASYGQAVTVMEDNKVSVTLEKVLVNPGQN
jgi:5-hydroxyisourate hydrolase-like protein (transthyretin family)